MGTTPSELRLTWRTKGAAKAALADELFGKRIIFTDRDEWSIADVVAGIAPSPTSKPTFAR